MSDPSWVRLSRRGQESSEPETLYEGIPAHLRHQLGAWYSRWLDDEMRDEIELHLRLDLRSTLVRKPWSSHSTSW